MFFSQPPLGTRMRDKFKVLLDVRLIPGTLLGEPIASLSIFLSWLYLKQGLSREWGRGRKASPE